MRNSHVSRRLFINGALAIGAGVSAVLSASASSEGAEGTEPYGIAISPEFPYEKKYVEINGSRMAYVDEGEGQPVLFLHGNPTSSYLWRNIIPYLAGNYRAVAPDLIGMGDSGKPEIAYTFEDHATYLDEFIKTLGLEDIILVIHDWGSALGMRYARLNPENVSALAFMEAIVPPSLPVPSYEAMGNTGDLFKALRTPGTGEEMVLENNFFIEEVLPKFGVARPMTNAEMDAYRTPFKTKTSRLPTLQWPREIPIAGEPAQTTSEVMENGEWLYSSDIPKLLFYADPGVLTPKPVVEHMIKNIKNLETRFIGKGLHFLQEEHPHIIGQGLSDWLRRL